VEPKRFRSFAPTLPEDYEELYSFQDTKKESIIIFFKQKKYSKSSKYTSLMSLLQFKCDSGSQVLSVSGKLQ
jgi:hypothetical protein